MGLLNHSDISSLGQYSASSPLKILTSACLSGEMCGYNGTSYGTFPFIQKLLNLPNVKAERFCPENFSFGTPRELCDIHGGNGYDVLDGKAKVLTDSGADWTEGMIFAAHKMLEVAETFRPDIVVLADFSAACGAQVIFEGQRSKGVYQQSSGVCAAFLDRNGYNFIGHKDLKTISHLLNYLNPEIEIDKALINMNETEEYVDYFGAEK